MHPPTCPVKHVAPTGYKPCRPEDQRLWQFDQSPDKVCMHHELVLYGKLLNAETTIVVHNMSCVIVAVVVLVLVMRARAMVRTFAGSLFTT